MHKGKANTLGLITELVGTAIYLLVLFVITILL